MKFDQKIFLAALASILLFDATLAFKSPGTTGPFVTGVRDGEFIDHTYPSNHTEDVNGRRIMYRVWYPACLKSDLVETETTDSSNGNTTTNVTTCGPNGVELRGRRKYLEAAEWEAYFFMSEPLQLTQAFDLTQSYTNVPPMEEPPFFPVVIYGHGLGSWVSDNTALLEEIASYGYIVFAVASPGFASGVLYPSDQHVSLAYSDYPEINATLALDPVLSPYTATFTPDLQVRYDRMKTYLTEGGMPALIGRYRDDMLALADHLRDAAASTATTTTQAASGDNSTFLLELLGGRQDYNLGGIVYMGYSLGGSAAGSAAHKDPSSAGAINIDGGHQSFDLFNEEIRVPYLMFFENTEIATFYHGEFLFESIDTMGSRTDIVRVKAPEGYEHIDYTDIKLFSQFIRGTFFGRVGEIDGIHLHNMLSDFCLSFIHKYIGSISTGEWVPDPLFDKYNDTSLINVTYVAEWARENSEEEPDNEEEPHDEEETPDDNDGDASSGNKLLASGLSTLLVMWVLWFQH